MNRQQVRRRRLAAGTILAVLTAALVTMPAAPAVAAVSGWEIVVEDSVTDGADVKTAVARCPTGKRLVGTGWAVLSNPGVAHVAEIRPYPDRVETVGYENPAGSSSTWSVRAEAICADPLPGLEIVTVVSPTTDSSSSRSALATCPTGKQMLGTAAEITGGGGKVSLNAVIPVLNSLFSGTMAVAYEQGSGGTGNVWNVKAHAICANPLPGAAVLHDSGAADSTGKWELVACPAGSVVTGAGAEVDSGTGEVLISADPGQYQGNRFVSASADEDTSGYTASWTLVAYVVCAQE